MNKNRLSPAGWLTLIVLLGLLVVAIVYAVQVWNSVDATMSGWGWLFMILGILVSVGLGAGLMALVFYSSRHNLDQ